MIVEGAPARIEITVRSASYPHPLVDPGGMIVTVFRPDGTTSSFDYALNEVVRDAQGQFHVNYLTTSADVSPGGNLRKECRVVAVTTSPFAGIDVGTFLVVPG